MEIQSSPPNDVTVADLMSEVQELRATSARQTAAIGQLHQTTADQSRVIAELSELLEKTTAALDRKHGEMSREISALRTSGDVMAAKLDTQVFFSVTMHAYKPVLALNTVVFDRVLSHVGGGYNSSTGVFTSPVSGYFSFQFNVMNMPGQVAEFGIFLNNERLCAARADKGFGYQCGSCAVTVEVKRGDRVQVVAAQESYPHNGEYAGFSGHLIYSL